MKVQERRERDRLRKQQDFFAAAEKLFALKGYENTSVNDIAREAGYAAGTLYLYFSNKDELLVSLLENKLADFNREMAVEIENISSPLEVFKRIVFFQIMGMIDYSETFMVIFPILIQPRWWEEHDKEGRLRSIIHSKDKLIRDCVETLIEKQLVRSDLDIDFFLLSLEGIIHEMVLCNTVKQKLDMKPEHIAEKVYDYATRILGISEK
jgi:TetR/AcrR family fatty acid metabolism transcriptional regulator